MYKIGHKKKMNIKLRNDRPDLDPSKDKSHSYMISNNSEGDPKNKFPSYKISNDSECDPKNDNCIEDRNRLLIYIYIYICILCHMYCLI